MTHTDTPVLDAFESMPLEKWLSCLEYASRETCDRLLFEAYWERIVIEGSTRRRIKAATEEGATG